jgi:hypothetical protein
MSSLREAVAEARGEGPEPEAEVEPQVAAGSVLASVRARAAQLQAEVTVDLPVPGYDNLVARYSAISISKFNKVGGAEIQIPFLDWRTAADALATALEGLYGLGPTGELAPLYADGSTARYDAELASSLGLAVSEPSARAVMVAVFGGGGKGESRVWTHFLSYQAWLVEGGAEEVASRAVGEQVS